MTWLLFMDESGHDHKNTPAEVRGGVAIKDAKIWPFIRAWQKMEADVFGVRLADYNIEVKGHRLLDKDRFKWAEQMPELTDEERRTGVRQFIAQKILKQSPNRMAFTAYGQACLEFSRHALQLIKDFDGVIFASVIPKKCIRPDGFEYDHFLRKDHVFLFERYYYFLESRDELGLLIMDESDKTEDRRFVRRMQDYFTRTQTGRLRADRIIPAPLFVASDMSVGVQAADIALYCINWGFRYASWNINGTERPEIQNMFQSLLSSVQFHGRGDRNGSVFETWGIFFVPDPYESRKSEPEKKRRR